VITYGIYLIFNVINFTWISPSRFTNFSLNYWIYAVTGLVLSTLLLALIVLIKKDMRANTNLAGLRKARLSGQTTKSQIQDVTSSDYANADISSVEAKKVAIISDVVATNVKSNSTIVEKTISEKTKDDLKQIEGIGEKIEALLNSSGIETFEKLAKTDTETLISLLNDAGPRFKLHSPESWPTQAEMARDGKWDELKDLKDFLVRGRKMN
jgi:predicted flap endonuclease-1-like 5' DNA nuclease